MLTYHRDFNTFYNLNREKIDRWIKSVAWRYRNIVEHNDMFQEIMLRLLSSTILQDWNGTKSSLSTFFTLRIRGYATHVAAKKLRSEPMAKYFVRLDKHHDFSEFDHDKDSPGKGYFFEICNEHTGEAELIAKEILAMFQNNVSPIQAEVYELYYMQGYTYDETTDIINTKHGTTHSYFFIRSKCQQALDIMFKITSAEGVPCDR